jgi:hypothetical protein
MGIQQSGACRWCALTNAHCTLLLKVGDIRGANETSQEDTKAPARQVNALCMCQCKPHTWGHGCHTTAEKHLVCFAA